MLKVIEYKNSGDMPNYAILVHSIKSDSKYLGFTHLAELAYNHEMKSKENDVEYVNANFEELENEVNSIIWHITTVFIFNYFWHFFIYF